MFVFYEKNFIKTR